MNIGRVSFLLYSPETAMTYSLELHDLCRLVRQMMDCVDVYRVGRRGNLYSETTKTVVELKPYVLPFQQSSL